MNTTPTLDAVILLLVKLLGAGVLVLALIAAGAALAWWIYKQAVGWPVIIAAMKKHKADAAGLSKQTAEGRGI